MLSNAVRVSRRARPCRTLLYQRRGARLASTSAAAVNPLKAHVEPWKAGSKSGSAEPSSKFKPLEKSTSIRTARIRTWEPVNSVVDVWAVTHALERKYGAILETHFLKDYEVPSKYQMMAWVVFRDPESLLRIPEKGQDFTIYAPEAGSTPIHEIGLEDLEQHSSAAEYQKDYEFENPQPEEARKRRVIGATIVRSETEFCENHQHRRLFQRSPRRTMENFLSWGGFGELEPLARRVEEPELFDADSSVDRVRMRAALQLCSDVTNIQLPHRTSKVDPENPLAAAAAASSQGSRIFAGLHDVKQPALGHANRTNKSETTTIASSSVEDVEKDISLEVAETVQEAIEATPTAPLSQQKAPPTEEELARKEILAQQMNAARLLQKSVTPVRRKQPKPPLMEPKKPQTRLPEFPVEEQPEQKGILGKLWGLFGR